MGRDLIEAFLFLFSFFLVKNPLRKRVVIQYLNSRSGCSEKTETCKIVFTSEVVIES